VEWLQTDTNLVGCIERKARVIKAPSYEEALATLSAEEAAGDWHFCRGVLEVETMEFKTYDEVAAGAVCAVCRWALGVWALCVWLCCGDAAASQGSPVPMQLSTAYPLTPTNTTPLADPSFGINIRTGQVIRLPLGGLAAPGFPGEQQHDGADAYHSSPASSKRGQRRRTCTSGGGGGGGGGLWDKFGGRPPKAGVMCFECGSKQTPQWREGPHGELRCCVAG